MPNFYVECVRTGEQTPSEIGVCLDHQALRRLSGALIKPKDPLPNGNKRPVDLHVIVTMGPHSCTNPFRANPHTFTRLFHSCFMHSAHLHRIKPENTLQCSK